MKRTFAEITHSERSESHFTDTMRSIVHDAYARELNTTKIGRLESVSVSNLDLGTLQDIYGALAVKAPEDTPIEKGQDTSEDAPEDNTPSNLNVETPSSGWPDESPESNTNPSHGLADSDTVSTDTQPAPVVSIAVANSTAFDPCCNVNTQAESTVPDAEGINAEGQTNANSATANADEGNNNAAANDAEGNNGSADGVGGAGDGGDSGD